MGSLYEKYRPRQWDAVVGQDSIIRRLALIDKKFGLLGQVFWLAGPSGCGKTTIARLIATEVAEDFGVEEVDAQDVGMDRIRGWEERCWYKPMKGLGYVFIVNEAHGLSDRVVSRLNTLLENEHVARNSTWVFTTTKEGENRLFGSRFDALPFLSRAICLELAFGEEQVYAFANHLKQVAVEEELDGRPLDDYCNLILECKGNCRQALQKIASGAMLP